MFRRRRGDKVVGKVTRIRVAPETVAGLSAGLMGGLLGEKAARKRKRVNHVQEEEDREDLASRRAVLHEVMDYFGPEK